MEPGFLSGQMLIAMPGIDDPRFERALLLVCAHDRQHAMGIAVNRPIEGVTVPDILEKLDITMSVIVAPAPVLLGGPVEPERGFILHTDDFASEQDLDAGLEGVTLTATREVLTAMAVGGAQPRRSLLALGYAGWGPGQLENELKQNVWLTCEPDEDLLFDRDYLTKWSRALAKLGVDPKRLSSTAGRA